MGGRLGFIVRSRRARGGGGEGGFGAWRRPGLSCYPRCGAHAAELKGTCPREGRSRAVFHSGERGSGRPPILKLRGKHKPRSGSSARSALKNEYKVESRNGNGGVAVFLYPSRRLEEPRP